MWRRGAKRSVYSLTGIKRLIFSATSADPDTRRADADWAATTIDYSKQTPQIVPILVPTPYVLTPKSLYLSRKSMEPRSLAFVQDTRFYTPLRLPVIGQCHLQRMAYQQGSCSMGGLARSSGLSLSRVNIKHILPPPTPTGPLHAAWRLLLANTMALAPALG